MISRKVFSDVTGPMLTGNLKTTTAHTRPQAPDKPNPNMEERRWTRRPTSSHGAVHHCRFWKRENQFLPWSGNDYIKHSLRAGPMLRSGGVSPNKLDSKVFFFSPERERIWSWVGSKVEEDLEELREKKIYCVTFSINIKATFKVWYIVVIRSMCTYRIILKFI